MTSKILSPAASGPAAAEVLAAYADFRDSDQEQWWKDVGLLFGRMLEQAQYGLHHQYQYLVFFMNHLLPALGPYQSRWRSFLTPIGQPVDLSINFQKDTKPTPRVTIEPLSYSSGTAQNPYGMVDSVGLMNQLAKIRLDGFDSQLFTHFSNDFYVSRKEVEVLQEKGIGKETGRTIATTGFVCKDGSITVKGYIFPAHKFHATGIPVAKLVSDSIRKLDPEMGCWDSFSLVHDYIEESTGWNEYMFLAWDCVDMAQSRLKIYGFHLDVAWKKIEEAWTLGGRLDSPAVMEGLGLLKQLWSLLYGSDTGRGIRRSADTPLESSFSDIVMWNYELRPGSARPAPKIYLPVSGDNDLTVAQSISEFCGSLGWTGQASSYPSMLRSIFPDQDMSQTSHLQAYISFAYSASKGVYMSVYYQSAHSPRRNCT